MFTSYNDAKEWFNNTYKRFSVQEDFHYVVIYINQELIDCSGFSVGSEEFPFKIFDSKIDFINYCDVLKKLKDLGVNYFESEY